MMIGLLVLSCLSLTVSAEIIKVGDIATKGHGVKGTLSIYNGTTLIVDNFEYDGGAPDAFFMVGDTKNPGEGGTFLPYPFEGKFFEYYDKNAPIIEGAHTGDKIILTLPSDKDVSDYKWFAVWCRAYSINFGDIYFPENLEVAEGESEPEGEFPSPIDSIGNDISGHKDHEYHHGDHNDAESEAESHAENEPHPGSASLSGPSFLALCFAVTFSLLLRKL